MGNFHELLIFTDNEIEGKGFKSFFEMHRPEYKVKFVLPHPSNLSNYKLITETVDSSLIIFDTDSIGQDRILDFLQDLAKHELKCIIYSRLTTPGLVLKAKTAWT